MELYVPLWDDTCIFLIDLHIYKKILHITLQNSYVMHYFSMKHESENNSKIPIHNVDEIVRWNFIIQFVIRRKKKMLTTKYNLIYLNQTKPSSRIVTYHKICQRTVTRIERHKVRSCLRNSRLHIASLMLNWTILTHTMFYGFSSITGSSLERKPENGWVLPLRQSTCTWWV